MTESKEQKKRRYYLHNKLREKFIVNARQRFVSIPAGEIITKPYDKYIEELRNMNYSIQLAIPN